MSGVHYDFENKDASSAKDEAIDTVLPVVENDNYELPLPISLADLSEHEIAILERKMVRKMDMIFMPIMGVLYILNYIDRQNLSAAKLQGIMEDLGMSTEQFATSVSILFVGYLPFQIPSNLFISKISRPGFYICAAVTIWGSLSAATAAVQSYKGLLAVRAILGASEAVFFPGAIYLLSAWYTKNELGKRIGGLYVAQQFGNAFGGLLAAGVLHLDGVHGIAGWRWLFIVEGVATVGMGIICSLFLPEFPHNARILNPQQRDLAVWRLQREAGPGEGAEEIGHLEGFLIGLKDIKLWALIWCNMMSQGMGSIANFFPTIVKTLGYNSTDTLLLTAPPYIFAGAYYYFMTWFSDRRNIIYPIIIFCICQASLTYIIGMSTTNIGARYFAMMLMPSGSVGPQLLLYKTINHHMPRPIAKRAAAVAMVNAIGGTSNIWASYLWYKGPYFYAAFGVLLANGVIFAATITWYKYYVRGQNKKLDEGGDRAKETMRGGVTVEQINFGWRYEGY